MKKNFRQIDKDVALLFDGLVKYLKDERANPPMEEKYKILAEDLKLHHNSVSRIISMARRRKYSPNKMERKVLKETYQRLIKYIDSLDSE